MLTLYNKLGNYWPNRMSKYMINDAKNYGVKDTIVFLIQISMCLYHHLNFES